MLLQNLRKKIVVINVIVQSELYKAKESVELDKKEFG